MVTPRRRTISILTTDGQREDVDGWMLTKHFTVWRPNGENDDLVSVTHVRTGKKVCDVIDPDGSGALQVAQELEASGVDWSKREYTEADRLTHRRVLTCLGFGFPDEQEAATTESGMEW